ncbi:MAG: LL-diaminopimelate aminotransferase [Chloroflexi bacterium]|nr:LL-diaminopimelate aminotransferase [Chloroflexota bacterium]|tara:strand:- start:22970 stop:24121 length:1152 start_codon:yes stop_codon:yes gene_type:complete
MKIAKRLDKIPPYLFVEISKKIAEKKSQGIEIINFGIGDPDLPTPNTVITELQKTSLNISNHRYPETDGLPEFRTAIQKWYQNRFNLSFNPETEILPLIGAKEGIGHTAFCFIDNGDIALIPDPGYPVYSVGTWFAGGECYTMPLTEDNQWLPDLDAIPKEIAQKAKVMWLNYPNNPTSAIADIEYFKRVVDFAKKYEIIILHDACYTEVSYDGYQPISFMETPGAKDISLEFHSLSKSYNMTGWRVGYVVGNSKLINPLMIVKSNLDSGIPQAIQSMAITALNTKQEFIDKRNSIYEKRRDKVVGALNSIGLNVEKPKASLYIWAKIPNGFTSAEYATKLLDEKDIVVTPGSGYGEYGEGYIRLSLTIPDEQLDKGINKLIN